VGSPDEIPLKFCKSGRHVMNVMTRITSIRLIEQMKAQPEYARTLGLSDTSRYVDESESKGNDLKSQKKSYRQ
jgi:hypothetical protein